MFPPAAPAPVMKTYTVYLSPASTVQVQSASAPTVDEHGMLIFPTAVFNGWGAWIENSAIPAPAPVPAPTSGGGIFGWLTK